MSGPRITDAAVEALAVWDLGGDEPWEQAPDYVRARLRGEWQDVVEVALPHIRRAVIEELVEKYEAECYRCGPLSQDRWDRTGAIRLLRAELEGDGE